MSTGSLIFIILFVSCKAITVPTESDSVFNNAMLSSELILLRIKLIVFQSFLIRLLFLIIFKILSNELLSNSTQ